MKFKESYFCIYLFIYLFLHSFISLLFIYSSIYYFINLLVCLGKLQALRFTLARMYINAYFNYLNKISRDIRKKNITVKHLKKSGFYFTIKILKDV